MVMHGVTCMGPSRVGEEGEKGALEEVGDKQE